MRKPKLGRPSPALIVATAALVVALGGTAVAASRINGNLLKPQSVGGGKLRQFTGGLLKKESLGGNKLKRQTVGGGRLRQFTAGLLKKQSLGAGKVKKDTLGGFQIDEDRLGPVPAAKSVVGNSRYMVKLAFGQSAALATVGPFTLTGQCVHDATDLKGGRVATSRGC